MELLADQERQRIRDWFTELTRPVRLVTFTEAEERETCALTRELATELAALSPRISAEVLDLARDAEAARAHGVDKLPALVVRGERDHGVRFFGVPAGFEFTALVEAVLDVGGRGHRLPGAVLDELARIDRPVRLEVLVKPTCPYCPRAVRAAHRLALASELVSADMIETTELGAHAPEYRASAVPATLIDRRVTLAGAQTEMALAQAIVRALGR